MKTILVLGATGQVGSQIVKMLDAKGYAVKAVVRKPNTFIDGASSNVEYCIGDLGDPNSLRKHLNNVSVVIATANTAVPVNSISPDKMYRVGYKKFIEMCEEQGVEQFIVSSSPTSKIDNKIPEIRGKRMVESYLMRSKLKYSIIRNSAFMDVWLVVTGCGQMENPDPHATTKRPFWFLKFWNKLVGNFVCSFGLMFAPGGKNHGASFIAAQDVAKMMVGCVENPWAYRRIIAGDGCEFITWRQVADLYAKHLKRKVRIIPMPVAMITFFQTFLLLFSASASSVLGIMRFVAKYRSHYDSKPIIEHLKLPQQITVADYIAERFKSIN